MTKEHKANMQRGLAKYYKEKRAKEKTGSVGNAKVNPDHEHAIGLIRIALDLLKS